MMNKFWLPIFCLLFTNSVYAFWWQKDVQDTPEQVLAKLEKQQIDHPDDALINYNVGVALYKQGKFEQAKNNFDRALKYSGDNKLLAKKAYFNMGNSYYKNALALLGSDWEKKDVDVKVLDNAIEQVKPSIEQFKNFLVLAQEDESTRGKKNLKKSEELLKKLEEKKKKQEEQKQQQDQQKDQKQDQKKDQQQDQKKDKQDQEQKKKDQQDKQQDQKQQQDQRQDQQKDQDQKQNQKQDQKQNQDQQDKKHKQDQQQNQQEQKQQAQDQNSSEQKQQGQQHKEQEKQQQEQQEKREQQGQEQKEEKEQAQQGLVSVNPEHREESFERRGMRAVLDNLQEDESKLQKALIQQHMKSKQPENQTGQKPW